MAGRSSSPSRAGNMQSTADAAGTHSTPNTTANTSRAGSPRHNRGLASGTQDHHSGSHGRGHGEEKTSSGPASRASPLAPAAALPTKDTALAPPAPTSGAPSPIPPNGRYRLIVLQSPKHARMCGICEKDRRTVDPPPILELVFETEQGPQPIPDEQIPFLLVHATLWAADESEERTMVWKDMHSTKPPAILGVNTRPVTVYPHPHREGEGYFFIFNDLSTRVEGSYKFRFALVELNGTGTMTDGAQVVTHVFSDVFNVHTPRSFPGVMENSHLTIHFASCVRIPTRRRTANSAAASSTTPRASKKPYVPAMPGPVPANLGTGIMPTPFYPPTMYDGNHLPVPGTGLPDYAHPAPHVVGMGPTDVQGMGLPPLQHQYHPQLMPTLPSDQMTPPAAPQFP